MQCSQWVLHGTDTFVLLGVQSREVTIAGTRINPEEDVGVYGRSVTFVPPSPNLTARFR